MRTISIVLIVTAYIGVCAAVDERATIIDASHRRLAKSTKQPFQIEPVVKGPKATKAPLLPKSTKVPKSKKIGASSKAPKVPSSKAPKAPSSKAPKAPKAPSSKAPKVPKVPSSKAPKDPKAPTKAPEGPKAGGAPTNISTSGGGGFATVETSSKIAMALATMLWFGL